MGNLRLIATIGASLFCAWAYAAAPANAPAGTTGLCNDGTFYSGATKKGACKGHKGVKDWYAEPAAARRQPPRQLLQQLPQNRLPRLRPLQRLLPHRKPQQHLPLLARQRWSQRLVVAQERSG